ncbi:MAG TPA: carboxypeptidase regulatory-like domain-containing protein [Mucilaginibacter sp.]|jgi:hypothetical protein
MVKTLTLLIILLPFCCYAQFKISGRIFNHANTKPISNASVFLSNSSIGDKTIDDGTFTLANVKPGKYELVVSIVGFESYHQTIIVDNTNVVLTDILIFPKTLLLSEVKIKPKTDPDWEKNFNLFKDEFLGTSEIAKNCKILNPELLDLTYDVSTSKLTASSVDFLKIENATLGYRIKYLLTNFTMDYDNSQKVDYGTVGVVYNNKEKPLTAQKVHYEGSALFENLKGTSEQQKRWQKRRLEIYKGSEMHFLRSIVSNRIEEEGFRVLQVAIRYDPKRPKKVHQTLQRYPLNKAEIAATTDQPGIYELGCEGDALHVTYNSDHHFSKNGQLTNLGDASNTDVTIVNFNAPFVFFDSSGGVINPNGLSFFGAWGRNRMADLLPVDFEPPSDGSVTKDITVAENIVTKLKRFSERYTTEKAYIHFDKPYYAAGDTIYFKAYLTAGERHLPSNISSLLNVDLIDANNKIDQSIKLQITESVAWGDLALSDSLPKGNYRLRAYTNWMRNDGELTYFDQVVVVGSTLNSKVPESNTSNTKTANAKTDIQFLPEGGQLVNGLKSKIAFKAIGTTGLGIDTKGVVVDGEDKEVTSFASTRLGMGSFYLTPQEGKSYKVKLSYADGTENIADLPIAGNEGITLSVNNDSLPKASVRIEASKLFYQQNKNKEYSLVIYSGGILKTITCTLDSPVTTLDILKRHLQTGVASVTLFSSTGEPLCERLFFVQNYDQLSIAVSSDKPVYAKREKVNIKLNINDRAGNPSEGHFSVSVVDGNKVAADENAESTILTNLLLTSDLKGYIEQPNYYFTNITDKTQSDLDLVMLTHGYRRFDWKQVLENTYPPVTYQPDSGLAITGTATSLGNKPLAKAVVSLIAMRDGSFINTVTDDQGHFRFNNLGFPDTARFMLQAVNSKEKNDTKLIYDNGKPEPVAGLLEWGINGNVNQLMYAYLENNKMQRDQFAQYGDIKGKMLKTVTIKGKKVEEHNLSNNLVSEEFADQVIHADRMAKGGPFSYRIEGLLNGITIIRKVGMSYAVLHGEVSKPMRLIVDGVDTDGDLDKLSDLDVKSVDVLKFAGTTGAYSGFVQLGGIYKSGYDGVLVVNTNRKLGLQAVDIASIGILPIKPKGFYKAREFYSPKYDHISTTNNRPDLRSTIYWKPELVTDKDGNTSFEYYNADGTGTYILTIEGIDNNGHLGRQVYRYKVE